jgi:mannose/fructose/N-acetylgalactosamine-specific phosphotransferase system component IID
MLALSWPASMRSQTASTLNGVSASMLIIGLILGPLVLNHWRRPVVPCTRSAQHLLREQGERQIRRITTWLNMSLGASMLLIVVIGGLIQ